MEELINKLRQRIEDLLEEHRNSQERQQTLTNEKKRLQDKHHMAISQIERMIARLKLLEKSQL